MRSTMHAAELLENGFVSAGEGESIWIRSGSDENISLSIADTLEKFVAIYSNVSSGDYNEYSSDDFKEVLDWGLSMIE